MIKLYIYMRLYQNFWNKCASNSMRISEKMPQNLCQASSLLSTRNSMLQIAWSFIMSYPMIQPSYSGLSVVMRAGIMVMILIQSSNPPSGRRAQRKVTGEEQSQEQALYFLLCQRNWAQRIFPTKLRSQFHILL